MYVIIDLAEKEHNKICGNMLETQLMEMRQMSDMSAEFPEPVHIDGQLTLS